MPSLSHKCNIRRDGGYNLTMDGTGSCKQQPLFLIGLKKICKISVWMAKINYIFLARIQQHTVRCAMWKISFEDGKLWEDSDWTTLDILLYRCSPAWSTGGRQGKHDQGSLLIFYSGCVNFQHKHVNHHNTFTASTTLMLLKEEAPSSANQHIWLQVQLLMMSLFWRPKGSRPVVSSFLYYE